MGEDGGKLDALKDQYLEQVATVLPLSQAFFIVTMSLVHFEIWTDGKKSTIAALADLGLKEIFNLEDGLLWKMGLSVLAIAYVLSLFNSWLIRRVLRWSLQKAGVDQLLKKWQQHALQSVIDVPEAVRLSIKESIRSELQSRVKTYKAKRLVFEVLFAVSVIFVYASGLLLYQLGSTDRLELSRIDTWVAIVAFGICCFKHKSSVEYAVGKILPLKVYLGAASGEITFLDDISD